MWSSEKDREKNLCEWPHLWLHVTSVFSDSKEVLLCSKAKVLYNCVYDMKYRTNSFALLIKLKNSKWNLTVTLRSIWNHIPEFVLQKLISEYKFVLIEILKNYNKWSYLVQQIFTVSFLTAIFNLLIIPHCFKGITNLIDVDGDFKKNSSRVSVELLWFYTEITKQNLVWRTKFPWKSSWQIQEGYRV